MVNVETVKNKIAAAAEKSGRRYDDITVVCATKTTAIHTIARITQYGFHIGGENKVQELLSKYRPLEGVSWHIIGQLQSNKVKYIIDKVDMVQSLDRLSLAAELQKQCAARGRSIDCLVEVNISGIEGRGGVEPRGTAEFIKSLEEFDRISVKGLMTVLPVCQSKESLVPYCVKMKDLFDDIRSRFGGISVLSMGMSDDYECAIENGATMVRLGRALFGERNI